MANLTASGRKALGKTVQDLFGHRGELDGEVGIEIECEGNNLAKRIPSYWTTHADGSLRGESIEYVLAKPIKREEVKDALKVLNDRLAEAGSVVNESYRTSVHVHLNARNMNLRKVFNQLVLYMLFEDLLVEFCGKDRIGNLFCLRAQDAEQLIAVLTQALKTGRYDYFHGDQLRYAAVNINALTKYGSLEFRAFRGTTNSADIELWVDILLKIKDAANNYHDPRQICTEFSMVGPKVFMATVLGPKISAVLEQFKDYEKRLVSGVRLAQDIAFAVEDWTDAKPSTKNDGLDTYGGMTAPNILKPRGMADFVAEIAMPENRPRWAFPEQPLEEHVVAFVDDLEPDDDDFDEPDFPEEPDQDEDEEF